VHSYCRKEIQTTTTTTTTTTLKARLSAEINLYLIGLDVFLLTLTRFEHVRFARN
jgi:hypothetical protein